MKKFRLPHEIVKPVHEIIDEVTWKWAHNGPHPARGITLHKCLPHVDKETAAREWYDSILCGPPKPTSTQTADELLAIGIVGHYFPRVRAVRQDKLVRARLVQLKDEMANE